MHDIVIIGGGIVGLATGVKILQSRTDLKIAILEKENELAKHQTANNSGVIHSGLYYKPGSLKAINCINGYNELIKFCSEENIPFELQVRSLLRLVKINYKYLIHYLKEAYKTA